MSNKIYRYGGFKRSEVAVIFASGNNVIYDCPVPEEKEVPETLPFKKSKRKTNDLDLQTFSRKKSNAHKASSCLLKSLIHRTE